MNLDKKIYAVLAVCSLLILGVSLLFAMPGVLERQRLSVQEWLAADAAGRFSAYFSAASAELADNASSPLLQSWDPGGRQPDLFHMKRKSVLFTDFFLFNSHSEMVKSSSANTVQSLRLPAPGASGHRPGVPVLAVLTGSDGINSTALAVPVINPRGQQYGWLAGKIKSEILGTGQTQFSGAGEVISLYLSDGESIVPLLEGPAGYKEINNLSAIKRIPAERHINAGNLSLVSAGLNAPGWWLVTVRHRAQSAAVLFGENRNIILPAILISLVLLTFSAYLVRLIIRPSVKLVSKLAGAADGGRADADSLAGRLDKLTEGAGALDNAPIGVMVVDNEGIIGLFNREAGEITGLAPDSVKGRPVKDFFPSNYHNYIMESVVTQREFVGLKNIIMVGDFFKELLVNVSPLYRSGTVAGAVATLQDVTPQRRLIEVKAAYNLARDLTLQNDLDSTVEVIAKAAAEIAEVEHTAVFIADQEGSLILRSAFGIPQGAVKEYNARPYKTGGPEIIEMYGSGAPLLHGDVRNRKNLNPMLIMPEIMSFYSFPIYYQDQLIGLVNLYSGDRNKLSREKIYLIRSLSGQLSAAISNFYEFQKMKAMAAVDSLTGLINKKQFLERIEAVINCASPGAPLSLAMLDIDFFKNVNDRYGHQAGDNVLVEVSRILRQSLRETDIICRYGGEEFAVIMPGTPRDRALDVMDRVRSVVEGAPIAISGLETLSVTVSCGVACCPEDAGDSGALIMRSDTALYTAKRTGRNKVLGYDPEQTMSG